MSDTTPIRCADETEVADNLDFALRWIERLDRILEARLRQCPRYRDLRDESAMYECHLIVCKARSVMIARIERNVQLLRDASRMLEREHAAMGLALSRDKA